MVAMHNLYDSRGEVHPEFEREGVSGEEKI
jgi:hypothetical protein